ncbi:hypothetical protein ACFFJQ_23395 [Bacillus capparidis]|uniref:Uncharacterized protein n=1 Tax=Bacillus capparidis TaxID=1840411 RepID=A0ABS4CYA2_9BACI|nr:hypothetical protein [Bacillus capparidis]MBP1082340.1 hypothetical protein [Bacillus capparidis]MED1097401.1 hypothetical protein [Bacillus capparidis]
MILLQGKMHVNQRCMKMIGYGGSSAAIAQGRIRRRAPKPTNYSP